MTFSENTPTAYPVFYRTYSRRTGEGRETWEQVCRRTVQGLTKLGNLTPEETELIYRMQSELKTLSSGRWLWVGGTEWIEKPENFFGAYNCSSTNIVDWRAFGLLMDLAMMGCGTGAVLEPRYINQLPVICNRTSVTIKGQIGEITPNTRKEKTEVEFAGNEVSIIVGDSRQGWVKSYQALLEISSDNCFNPDEPINVTVDISNVRLAGERLKGFGGVANPIKLAELYERCSNILNKTVGRQLNSVECSLLIDEAAVVVVAGNVRRCLPADALVHTSKGLVPIEKVQIGDMVQTPIGFRRVSNKFDQGLQNVYEINLESGRRARSTLNHKWCTGGDFRLNPLSFIWKAVSEVKNGDFLYYCDDLLSEKPEPKTDGFLGIGNYEAAQTYDIEVEEAHCFYCDGYLTHNSAGIRLGSSDDELFANAKMNLWQQDNEGNWRIDPERDALRMANHSRAFHHKPTLEETIEAVSKQYHSGEGAIQWAGEAVARSNVDLLPTELKEDFLNAYHCGTAKQWLTNNYPTIPENEINHRLGRYGLNPCGEIVGANFMCNLAEVHLNQIDPTNLTEIKDAFNAAAINVGALLNHQFTEPRYKDSRELDPIVGVSFTGLFDFFVTAFGVDWLRWWEAGRPSMFLLAEFNENTWNALELFDGSVSSMADHGEVANINPHSERYNTNDPEAWNAGLLFKDIEAAYLQWWRRIVHQEVWNYCDKHGIKRPNRCTTVQPAGSKSLLTGASPGWHPPKSQRFIRRITFAKNDPVALACIDYGYSITPSQSDKDENGVLLNDPFDERCTEWLVEIPVSVPWANLPGADQIDISKFSAVAQFDFYMQVQKHYATHNCFSRDTEFLTDKGIASFENFEEGEKVLVLNKDGIWTPATIVSTKEPREMIEIEITQGKTGAKKKITSTLCHRFPVRRISGGDSPIKIVEAKDLKIGHRLVTNGVDTQKLDVDGIRHGIVFGDGSLYRNGKKEYVASQLYLCGAKRSLQPYFNDFKRTFERDELDQTRIYGLPKEWKSLPNKDMSQEYLAGFLAGLLATDGNITGSTISISSAKKEVVEYIENQCPRLGIRLTSWKWYESSGYKEGGGAFQICFSKSTFPEEMILRSHHYEHYQSQQSQPCQWRVTAINPVESQIGWCVMEPLTNHFTLKDNILVMNTSSTIELREDEIEPLGTRIYEAIQNDEGYVSSALLARFDDRKTYPRLPFESISKEQYEKLTEEVKARRKTDDFHATLAKYDTGEMSEAGPAGCDSDKCMFPITK